MSLVIIVEFPNLSHKYYYSRSDPTHGAESVISPSQKHDNFSLFKNVSAKAERVEIFCFTDFSPLYFLVVDIFPLQDVSETWEYPHILPEKPLRCDNEHSQVTAVHYPRYPLPFGDLK